MTKNNRLITLFFLSITICVFSCKKNEILKVPKLVVTDPLASNELDDFDSNRILSHTFLKGYWTLQKDKDRGTVLAQQDSTLEYAMDMFQQYQYTDVDIKAYWKILGGEDEQMCGVIVRAKDAENYVVVMANAKDNFLRVMESNGGKLKTLAKARITPPASPFWHNTRVVWIGNKLQAYLDTKLLIETEVDGFEKGTCGLYTGKDSRIAFDEIFLVGSRK